LCRLAILPLVGDQLRIPAEQCAVARTCLRGFWAR
jgi:hypothetical protein